MKILRMLGALVAGYAVMTLGVVAATLLMGAVVPGYGDAGTGTPPAGWMAVNLAYSAAFVCAGAYVAQWIAGGGRPVVPFVMGALMVVLSLGQFGQGVAAWPAWYRAGLLLLPVPMAWLGGALRIRRAGARATRVPVTRHAGLQGER